MEFKVLTYFSVLVLCLYYLSIGIVAAPVNVRSDYSEKPVIYRTFLDLESKKYHETTTLTVSSEKPINRGGLIDIQGGWRGEFKWTVLTLSINTEDWRWDKMRNEDRLVDWGYSQLDGHSFNWIIFKK